MDNLFEAKNLKSKLSNKYKNNHSFVGNKAKSKREIKMKDTD